MILVLLGPPGVGKGTQGGRIAVHYAIPTISTGAIFRAAVAKGDELGRVIQRYKIEQGEYVPDDVVIAAVKARTTEPDCEKGFLLDGFPRTIPQADALGNLLTEQNRKLTGALLFEAPIADIVRRFSGRRVCPLDGSTYHIETQPPLIAGRCDLCQSVLIRRPDDEPEIVQRRLELYNEKTAPLIAYYRERGLLTTVNANLEPETVFSHVITALNSLTRQ